MAGILGQLSRRLGVYGPARALKARLDRLIPTKIRHQRKLKSFYTQFFHANDLVFDIGANVGNRSDVFLELGAKVVAVEPQPICVEVLTRLFQHNKKFTLVPKALGDAPGEARMFLADANVLSTLSSDWIEKTTKSGRFAGQDWRESITVPVTTMDALIAEHGVPIFCKIDVEGFEAHVLNGLSQPIRTVSFELAAEAAENAVTCINRLSALGRYRFNFSSAESMIWERSNWLGAEEMIKIVREKLAALYFGDIYARIS